MITKFGKFNLITEDPDSFYMNNRYGQSTSYSYNRPDAKAFFVEVNDDHTKVVKLYMSIYGNTHGDIKNVDYIEEKSYAGRIWKRLRVISFWVYPNVKLFRSIVNELEKKLKTKIFNNGWRIEVKKTSDDEIYMRDPEDDEDNYYFGSRFSWGKSRDIAIIPVEEYVGSEDFSEEDRIQHMMNWKEKEQAKKAGKLSPEGFGSTKTAWDEPHNIKYRRVIYQENMNNDNKI